MHCFVSSHCKLFPHSHFYLQCFCLGLSICFPRMRKCCIPQRQFSMLPAHSILHNDPGKKLDGAFFPPQSHTFSSAHTRFIQGILSTLINYICFLGGGVASLNYIAIFKKISCFITFLVMYSYTGDLI